MTDDSRVIALSPPGAIESDLIVASLDRARHELAQASTPRSAKYIADVTAAAEVYARRQGLSEECIGYAHALRIDALALLGGMLREKTMNTGAAGGGTKTGSRGTVLVPRDTTPTLADLGLDKKTSAAAQRLAALPEEQLAKVRGRKLSIEKAFASDKKDQQSAKRAATAPLIPASQPEFMHGDFRDLQKYLPDSSVNLIFCDPPYNRESLGLYGDLAETAARVLEPGGSLLAYCGHYLLPDIFRLMQPHLRFWWLAGCHHDGGQYARMTEYGIIVRWKPIVWFVKETRGDKETFVEDIVSGGREKDAHPWQQSEIEAAYYIEKLSRTDGLIFDPFCGGGTTAAAAAKLGRRFFTCDVDDVSLRHAAARVRGEAAS